MSDSQRSDDRAPRSGAGDAARTQPIPRISREKRPRTVADALREARSAPVEPTSPSSQRRPGPARPARGAGSAEPTSDATTQTPAASESAAAESTATESTAAESTAAESAPAAKSTDSSGKKQASSATTPRKSSRQGAKPAAAAAASSAAPAASEIRKPAEPSSGARAESERARARGTSSTAASSTSTSRESTPTAADYARTTGGSADTTSVMPAVKDEPRTTTGKATRTDTSRKDTSAAAAPAPASGSGRQAKLRLTFIEPWSVTRLAFVVSVALMIVAVVAVTIFWIVLEITGIWGSLNDTVLNVLSDSEGSFDLTDYLGLGRLVGLTLVLSAVNVVLMTAVATIGAHLYNLFAQLLGGIEVTFTDD